MSIVLVIRDGIIYEERCAFESYKSDKGTTVKPKTQEEFQRYRKFSDVVKETDENKAILNAFNEVLKKAKVLSTEQEAELIEELSENYGDSEINSDVAKTFFEFCRNGSEVDKVDDYLAQIDKFTAETTEEEKHKLLKVRQLLFLNMSRPYQARRVAGTLKNAGWKIELSDYGDFFSRGNIIGVSKDGDSAVICFSANGDVIVHSEIYDTDKRKKLQETVLQALQDGGATNAMSYCDKEQKSLKQVKKVQAKKKNISHDQKKNIIRDTGILKKEQKQGVKSDG